MGMIKHFQSTQSNKFALSLNYLKKEVRDGVIFCLQINMKVSYKVILTFWVCLARPSQSTHNFSVWLGWCHAAKLSHFELWEKC